MQTKHYIWLALVVGLIIGIGGWLVLSPKQAAAPSTTATSTNSGTTSTSSLSGLGVQTTGQATVSEVTTTSAPKPPTPPALAIAASLNFGDDVKQALQTQWNTLTSELKASPMRVDLILQLGTTYKIAGQYDAAIAEWTYVAKYGPHTINYIAYGNMGDLYLNFLHDYPKAVAAYQLALKGAPTNADYQAGLKTAQQFAK